METTITNNIIKNNITNIYMFKNPLRFFLNIEKIYKLEKSYVDLLKDDDVSWTTPANFKIRKYYGKKDFRMLKLPNLLNFFFLYNKCKNEDKFYDFNRISLFSRVKVNVDTGDFVSYVYQIQLEKDLDLLTKYDYLYKFDIKSFYSSINTHILQEETKITFGDRFIRNLNDGYSSGILMGNYISLFLAEKFLQKIMEIINNKLIETIGISQFKLYNFSDDIYIFGYEKNESLIKKIINEVLFDFSLELNDSKFEKIDYLSHNNNNILTKYWKKIIHKQLLATNVDGITYNDKIKNNTDDDGYYLNILNQLIYRRNLLQDEKKKSIFINGFFKSKFFNYMNFNDFNITRENLHQIQFIIKNHPETVLYIIEKIKTMKNKKFNDEFFDFLKTTFFNSLEKDFYEEQLYYYFAIKKYNTNYNFEKEIIEKVMKSNNQILSSYFVMNEIDCGNHGYALEYLNEKNNNWILNYHIILKNKDTLDIDTYLNKYLCPKMAKESKRYVYIDFYKKLLDNNYKIINSISSVSTKINEFISEKNKEKTANASMINDYYNFI